MSGNAFILVFYVLSCCLSVYLSNSIDLGHVMHEAVGYLPLVFTMSVSFREDKPDKKYCFFNRNKGSFRFQKGARAVEEKLESEKNC